MCIATNVQVYFCDLRSPWQRGNENAHGLLLQYFPRGTDLLGFPQAAGRLSRRARGWRDVRHRIARLLRDARRSRRDWGDRRLLGRHRCRKRQAVRVIGPEHEYRREQYRRQNGGVASAAERQEVGHEGRDKDEDRQHRNIEPVHLRKIDRHGMSSSLGHGPALFLRPGL
jgi:hypothetical protein